MRPCTGIPKYHVPPYCTWAELNDGTYTLADVELFNQALDEIIDNVQHAD